MNKDRDYALTKVLLARHGRTFSDFGYELDQVRPGLQFEPPWEMDQHATLHAGSIVKQTTVAACINCGQTAEFDEGGKIPPCPRCQHVVWSSVE